MSLSKLFLSMHIIVGSQLIYGMSFNPIKNLAYDYFLKTKIRNYQDITKDSYFQDLRDLDRLETLTNEALSANEKAKTFTVEKYREIQQKKKVFYLLLGIGSFLLPKYGQSTISNDTIASIVIYSSATLGTAVSLVKMLDITSRANFAYRRVEFKKKISKKNLNELNKKTEDAPINQHNVTLHSPSMVNARANR